MKNLKECDLVEIKTKDDSYKGIVMPGSDDEKIILKLISGYNVGILKKNIVSLTTVKKFKGSEEKCEIIIEDKKQSKSIEGKKHLPIISILHTGGTVASRVDYSTGAVSARFTPEDIISMFPELKDIAQIRSKLIRNMFSEDMRFSHYNLLAKEIDKEAKNGANGIIITHGTDTLHYTAAALAFILEDLSIPVILVGSQRSSDRGSSDAALNLICAAQFIAKSDFAEVAICMHEGSSDESCLILPACKTRKLHTSSRDAFKVVNGSPIARIDKHGKLEFIHTNYRRKDSGRKLRLKLFKENLKIGLIKIHTNMYAKEFESYESFDGLVIEGTGLGHMPINAIDEFTKEHSKIFNTVKKLAKKMPVVMTSQTLYGRLQMNVYSTGRNLVESGVLGNYSDMIPEIAFIKLAWLLSNYNKDKVRELVSENLRGEISKRTELG
ncbi:MAG: Glu-tRNA(Gln) amidotransferase subunit GatD [Nanoarchaeota archaeon]